MEATNSVVTGLGGGLAAELFTRLATFEQESISPLWSRGQPQEEAAKRRMTHKTWPPLMNGRSFPSCHLTLAGKMWFHVGR